jgi:hypothetical protein
MPGHVALSGDSIFDNAAYTSGAPDVITHLRSILPAGWKASLLATDGAMTHHLPSQLSGLPSDVTHLVIAIGGNDILMNRDLLDLRVTSSAQALKIFGERVSAFEASYVSAISAAASPGRKTTVCTVYNGNLDPREAPLARVALTMFNDAILRTAFERGLCVIDLRLICREPADYVNAIEPSARGGKKIADAIATSLRVQNRIKPVSCVFAS